MKNEHIKKSGKTIRNYMLLPLICMLSFIAGGYFTGKFIYEAPQTSPGTVVSTLSCETDCPPPTVERFTQRPTRTIYRLRVASWKTGNAWGYQFQYPQSLISDQFAPGGPPLPDKKYEQIFLFERLDNNDNDFVTIQRPEELQGLQSVDDLKKRLGQIDKEKEKDSIGDRKIIDEAQSIHKYYREIKTNNDLTTLYEAYIVYNNGQVIFISPSIRLDEGGKIVELIASTFAID